MNIGIKTTITDTLQIQIQILIMRTWKHEQLHEQIQNFGTDTDTVTVTDTDTMAQIIMDTEYTYITTVETIEIGNT